LSAQSLDIFGVSARAAPERGGPGDEHVRSGLDRAARRLPIDAAIDLEVDRLAGLVDLLADRLDLAELAVDKCLPAENRD
jgi:hypothetical protein